ncbi:TPA: hypothetical protein I7108_003077 [Vibrio cholerae O1]|uniref:hypothetical protein n=1 Tax=Vibrio cholerae TaxID=666 RepID=UPI0004E2A519|nr:hypothetical protein [Vibrio cholerae]HAS2379473.1 hypothetical protein [Vibrio cholerae O1]EGR2474317.1 hypothetical protein [Vibrio cholerae]EGR4403610.1 hypothetical protein [Vibrio cholerae]ELZ1193166.1 hypothetical protein [Vibrio cholerae]KFD84666.1 hypothetical protein DN41_1525 [Vibrio cholerae]
MSFTYLPPKPTTSGGGGGSLTPDAVYEFEDIANAAVITKGLGPLRLERFGNLVHLSGSFTMNVDKASGVETFLTIPKDCMPSEGALLPSMAFKDSAAGVILNVRVDTENQRCWVENWGSKSLPKLGAVVTIDASYRLT